MASSLRQKIAKVNPWEEYRMSYEIVFNPDGIASFPDLPGELLPLAREFGASVASSDYPRPVSSGFSLLRQRSVPLPKACVSQISTQSLWGIHDAALANKSSFTSSPAPIELSIYASLLDIKTELARRVLAECDLCETRCGVNRWAREIGYCGSSQDAYYARCFINWGEEKHISPGITISLCGCNWHCVYCQYPEFLLNTQGILIEPQELAALIAMLSRSGGRTIHWVGGNPDQHVWAILSTLQACTVDLPVVWNSNGYASRTTLRILDGVVDTYLLDFRHWSAVCANRYGCPTNSADIIQRNLKTLSCDTHDLIVRHLQMPGHFDCCTAPILKWLAKETPEIKLNLMHGQYRPAHQSYLFPEINRRLTAEERRLSTNLAKSLNLHTVE